MGAPEPLEELSGCSGRDCPQPIGGCLRLRAGLPFPRIYRATQTRKLADQKYGNWASRESDHFRKRAKHNMTEKSGKCYTTNIRSQVEVTLLKGKSKNKQSHELIINH